ncbi:MAG TPA: hypothetical protein VJO34_03805 [Methylomirabilota bacterium]|nr:hypothetical protein [Methylomirabilota bacterium]
MLWVLFLADATNDFWFGETKTEAFEVIGCNIWVAGRENFRPSANLKYTAESKAFISNTLARVLATQADVANRLEVIWIKGFSAVRYVKNPVFSFSTVEAHDDPPVL